MVLNQRGWGEEGEKGSRKAEEKRTEKRRKKGASQTQQSHKARLSKANVVIRDNLTIISRIFHTCPPPKQRQRRNTTKPSKHTHSTRHCLSGTGASFQQKKKKRRGWESKKKKKKKKHTRHTR